MSDQWDDEQVDALAAVIYEHEQQTYVLDGHRSKWDSLGERQRDIWRGEARLRFGHFADLGLLLPPGGETRTEWAWTYEIVPGYALTPWNHCRDRVTAERQLAEHRERHPRDRMYLGRRDVHETPFAPVPGSDS